MNETDKNLDLTQFTGDNSTLFTLSEHTDSATFYGINNSNIRLIANQFPALQIMARGNIIKVIGSDTEMDKAIRVFEKMEEFALNNNLLDEENVIEIIKGNQPTEIKFDNLIVHGVNGRPVMARTKNQQKLVRDFDENDMLFAFGPAGSGKTYTAIALAVRSLKNREKRKIILSRPAVEAGEKLGFLPGDMKDKIDPYLQPLYDALQDMIPAAKLREYLENGTIQIAPLAFMRGRTLSDAIVILDEAQNTSSQQIKMFLTRMGLNTKMIITGDVTQIDLPTQQKSGLIDALQVLKGVRGVATIEFDKGDIVRHKLVQRIVEAYEKRDERMRLLRESEKKSEE